jgi:hypothetical protein
MLKTLFSRLMSLFWVILLAILWVLFAARPVALAQVLRGADFSNAMIDGYQVALMRDRAD